MNFYAEEGCLDAPDQMPAGSTLAMNDDEIELGFHRNHPRVCERAEDWKFVTDPLGDSRLRVPGNFELTL